MRTDRAFQSAARGARIEVVCPEEKFAGVSQGSLERGGAAF